MLGRAKLLISLVSGSFLMLGGCGDDSAAEANAPPVTAAPQTAPTGETTPTPMLTGELAEGFAPIAFDLAGTSWLVVEIDGEPLAERYSDLATVHFTSSMLYWQACNHHEGLYVRTSTSFAVGRMTASLASCEQQGPDEIMAGILGRRPLIGGNAEGKVMLVSEGRSMTLSQIDRAYKDTPPPPLEAGPFRLASTETGARPPVLTFDGGNFSIWMECDGAITGKVRVRSGLMQTSGVQKHSCETHRPTATSSLEQFLSHSPAIARGPNGELMLSDGDTVIFGQQCHPDPSGCEHAIDAGESRV